MNLVVHFNRKEDTKEHSSMEKVWLGGRHFARFACLGLL